MLHIGNSPASDGDKREHDGHDTWSSTFPSNNEQPFDLHSFGRMDVPVTPPTFNNSAVIPETYTLPTRQYEPCTAPSFNHNPLVLENVVSPLWSDTSRERYYEDSATSREVSGELDESSTSCKLQVLHRDMQPGEVTPYVGLRSRLTQIPINRWTILLILVLARLIILFEGLNTNLASAQDEAASACLKVEEIGSVMVSMPHYLSIGVNELVAMGITDTVRGLIKVLVMILSGLLGVLMFIIERTYGTIVCVATSFIKGLISLAAAAVEGLLQGIDDGLRIAVGGLSDAVDDFSKSLDSAISVADGIFGANIPSLNGVETAVEGLKNANFINATATFDSITDFDNRIPNFNGIIAGVQAVVGMPFTTAETLLNESFGNWSMDASVFPSASMEQLTFCTGNGTIEELFDVLFIVARSAKIIVICGILLAALLAAAFMAWFEVQRYRKTVVQSKILLNREPMDTVYISGRPISARTGLWISEQVFIDPDRRILTRWVVAYSTTYTALFVLSLAVAGAFSVLCQYFIMQAIQKEAPGLAQGVGRFVTNATNALEGSSAKWANESNQAILDLQNDINDKILVHLQDATVAVVNLVNTFENETTTLLQNFFGENPIGEAADNFTEGLLDCVIFNALDKVKSGITWINDEAHITLPELPFDVFSMGVTGSSGNSSFSTLLTNSGAQTANQITSALDKVVVTLQSSFVQEGLIALALFLFYIAYVLFAVAQAALRMSCMRDRHPKDVEKGGHAIGDIQTSDDTVHDERRLVGTTRSPSIASSYRIAHLDITQLIDETLATHEEHSPVKQMLVKHVDAIEVHEGDNDPFGDDTYVIKDEELDGKVGGLRDPRQMGDVYVSRISQCTDDDLSAIRSEGLDDNMSGLDYSEEVVESSGPRNRQTWVEDADK